MNRIMSLRNTVATILLASAMATLSACSLFQGGDCDCPTFSQEQQQLFNEQAEANKSKKPTTMEPIGEAVVTD